MKRRRAAGAGRKPSGEFSRLVSQLSIRMPAETRKQLESAAAARGRSVTQELLRRLHKSFDRDRDKVRSPEVRALCFLFGAIADRVAFPPVHGPDDVIPDWRTNPFLFAAFSLAVAKLLNALKPAGEIENPFINQDEDFLGDFMRRIYESPETLSDYAVAEVWSVLQDTRPVVELKGPGASAIVAQWKQEFYGMQDARRDLGIKLQGEKP
jgi:hypothetical protein